MATNEVSKPSIEDSFARTLEDMIEIAEKLEPHCQSVKDLVGMAKLALENTGQLKVLLAIITTPAPGTTRR